MHFNDVLLLFTAGCLTWRGEAMPNFGAAMHGQIRLKRSTKHQTLNDPGDCVHQCISEHSSRMSDLNSSYKMKLVMKAKQNGWSQKNPALEAAAIDNVHDMFKDMCKQSDKTIGCLQNCQKSDLRALALIRHGKSKEEMCYQANSIRDFDDYYKGETCARKVRDQSQCKAKCGSSGSVYGATGFKVDLESSPATVDYNTDRSANIAGAQKACKHLICLMDCNRPFITSKCGKDAHDWFVRDKKYEASASLASMRQMGVLGANEPAECADFD